MKIAILRASRIGDYICATPAFRAIRKAYPRAEISLIALPLVEPLADRNPRLDRFIRFPGFPGIAEQLYSESAATAFLRRMQDERFDLVLQMHGSGVFANPVALAMKGKTTAGFVRPQDNTSTLVAFPYDSSRSEIRRLLDLLQFLNIVPCGEETELPLTNDDRMHARALTGNIKRPWIGIHPTAADSTKIWPEQHFYRLAEKVMTASGGTLLLIGENVPASLRNAPFTYHDLSGRTSLPVVAAVIEMMDVLITNDSGPAHMAYALGTPSVTIFGSTDPNIWAPVNHPLHRIVAVQDVQCRPCAYDFCPFELPCLTGIDPNAVFEETMDVMDNASYRNRYHAG